MQRLNEATNAIIAIAEQIEGVTGMMGMGNAKSPELITEIDLIVDQYKKSIRRLSSRLTAEQQNNVKVEPLLRLFGQGKNSTLLKELVKE